MTRDETKGQEHLVARRRVLGTVFQAFSGRWPRAFSANRGAELMPVWLAALGDVELESLERLAVEYTATCTKDFPPSPPEFMGFVRRKQQRHRSAPTQAPAPRVVREWEWESPVTRRIANVQETAEGWSFWALDDHAAFLAMPDSARRGFCDEQAALYPVFKGAA